MMFTKLFNIFAKTQKTQIYKHWGSSAITFRISNMCTDASYTDIPLEDKEKILKVINSNSKEDLLKYSISEKRAENLESYRIKNGQYNSLEDLLQVKGMNNKSLYTFYKSIIYGKKRTIHRKFNLGSLMTPNVINNSQKDVNTVLGIYVGTNMISWSLLNRDCEVLQWYYKSFPQDIAMGNLHYLLQMIFPIAKMLPKAERYIMQESSGKGIRRLHRSHLQESIITTNILSYLLWNHKLHNVEEFLTNKIFILRQTAIPKVYGLKIGKDVISTQYVLQKLLQESERFMETKERLPSVLIRPELRNMYKKQHPAYQEQISWPLLIALAFIELVVHQRTDMMHRYTIRTT